MKLVEVPPGPQSVIVEALPNQPDGEAVEIIVMTLSGETLFHKILKPTSPIVMEHGVTDKMVENADYWPEVSDEFEKTVSGKTLLVRHTERVPRIIFQTYKAYHMTEIPLLLFVTFCRDKAELVPENIPNLDALAKKVGAKRINKGRAKEVCLSMLDILRKLEKPSFPGKAKAISEDVFVGIWRGMKRVYIWVNLKFRQRRVAKVITPGCIWRKNSHPAKRMDIIKADLKWFDKERVAIVLRDMEYKSFLKTPYWKTVADFVKWRDKKRCRRCGKRAPWLEAHHTTYDIRGWEIYNTDTLISLCDACHRREHGIEPPKKKSFWGWLWG